MGPDSSSQDSGRDRRESMLKPWGCTPEPFEKSRRSGNREIEGEPALKPGCARYHLGRARRSPSAAIC